MDPRRTWSWVLLTSGGPGAPSEGQPWACNLESRSTITGGGDVIYGGEQPVKAGEDAESKMHFCGRLQTSDHSSAGWNRASSQTSR